MTMSIQKIALIVDGPTEEGSLRAKYNKIYYDAPSIRIGPGNGVNYSCKGYAKGVMPTLILLLKSTIRAIILIPDLEKRKVDPDKFSIKLKNEIIKLLECETKYTKDYLDEVIYVCPPDIMFENWIVSDIEGIKKNKTIVKQDISQEKFDGKNGATVLQKSMITKYKKTVHAQMLFKLTDFISSKENSESFRQFNDCFEVLKNKHCL